MSVIVYGPETNPWRQWWTPLPPPRTEKDWEGAKRWPFLGTLFLLPTVIPSVRAAISGSPGAIAELVLMLCYGACYLAFPAILMTRRTFSVQLAFATVAMVLGWLLVLLGGKTVYILMYGMAAVAFGMPTGWVLIFNGSSVVFGFALVLLRNPVVGSIGDITAVAGITAAMFFVSRLIYAVRYLQLAQQEIATLAVTAERERLARDLHDILGHSLTTITVKAGLVRRVLESTKDIDRAIGEIREVEDLSRSALSDVRATVSDYREVSLLAELVGAKAALRAAEIDADLPHAVDNVRTDLQQTFGYVLREAVTNVVRHSGAKQVKVRFGRNWMEIEDDGRGGDAPPGNGLRGLRERLARFGGTLVAAPRPGGGFLVRAEVTEQADRRRDDASEANRPARTLDQQEVAR